MPSKCVTCGKRANFNFPGQKQRRYCSNHKDDTMIYITSRKCEFIGCNKQPNYGYASEKKSIYCGTHKLDGMIDVANKKCLHDGCTTRPNFNILGEKKGIYCGIHKLEGMRDVKSNKCKFKRCLIRPSYNYINNKKGIYCKTHKLPDMVYVKQNKCLYEECDILPSYNYTNEKHGLYCKDHKLDDMVNVVSRTCLHEGCTTRPTFNILGEKTGLYCKIHKLDNMISIKSKNQICRHQDCETRASFKSVVNRKKCIHPKCNKRPGYNFPNEKVPLYCHDHKLNGMVDIVNRSCPLPNCYRQPRYNYMGNKTGMFCSDHKEQGMVDVLTKRCKSEWCDIMAVKKKFKGYCYNCFVHNYPNDVLSRNYKTKELQVQRFIQDNIELPDGLSWIHDKPVGPSQRRPDNILNIDDMYYIIVEVDENQHNVYNYTCENRRIMEISRDLGHKPLIFIRFNPDDYIDITGKKIKSCWNKNTRGIYQISKSNEKRWDNRLNKLAERIIYWGENGTDKLVEIEQLYYDGFVNDSIVS